MDSDKILATTTIIEAIDKTIPAKDIDMLSIIKYVGFDGVEQPLFTDEVK